MNTGRPMRQPIVLDCDPGHDDAIAILLAAASPSLELVAITTVAGNQSLDKTALNARRICSVAGIRDVPVAAGCDAPLVRQRIAAGNIHGESGLDGPAFGPPTVPLDRRHGVDVILDAARAHDDLVVVAGPARSRTLPPRSRGSRSCHGGCGAWC